MLVPHSPAHVPIIPTSGPGVASGAQDWGAVAAACFLLKKWKITSAEQNGGCDSPGTARLWGTHLGTTGLPRDTCWGRSWPWGSSSRRRNENVKPSLWCSLKWLTEPQQSDEPKKQPVSPLLSPARYQGRRRKALQPYPSKQDLLRDR